MRSLTAVYTVTYVVIVSLAVKTTTAICQRACILGIDGHPTSCMNQVNSSHSTTPSTDIVVRDTTTIFPTTLAPVGTTISRSVSTLVANSTPATPLHGQTTRPTSSPSFHGSNTLPSLAVATTAKQFITGEYNFEYGVQYGDLVIGSYDDYCTFLSITPIPIFGTRYKDIYVCTNGVVSFNGSYTAYTPTVVTAKEGLSLLAPYHADIDFSYGSGAAYYHIYHAGQNGTNMNLQNMKTAESLITRLTGRSLFTIQTMLIVTWDKGQHYQDRNGLFLNKTVSFQLVLVSDGVYTYAVYKYFPAKMRFNGTYDVFVGYMFQSQEYNQHSLSFTRNALQIDRYVETKGIQGVLLYPLTHETLDTISDQTFVFGAENGDKLLRYVDDGCSEVPNSYMFPLFNTLHREIFVCSNGIVTIDRPYVSPNIPNDFMSMSPKLDVLMPYYTDTELRNDGVVYYQVNDATKDDDFRQRQNVIKAEAYVRDMKTNTRYFEAQFLLLVTWHKVAPYPAQKRSNETMSFQLVLVSDGLDTYVLYIYFEHEMNLRINNVIIGYMTRSGQSSQHWYSSTPFAWNIANILRKNGGKGAILYELTDLPNQDNLPTHKCIKWYSRNNPGKALYNESMSQMPDCPCTMDFLRRDPRFTILRLGQGDAQCSYMRPSWWFRPLGVGKTCCYHDSLDQHFVQSGPYAGGYTRYNPWFFQNWHVRDDLQMRENCCEKSDLCNLYHALRPIGSCYTTFPLQFGNFWGDPHIQTLDGRKYTFNGYGEYILLNLDTDNTSFSLQARTSRAENADGNVSDATIFSAFSAKDDRGVQVQVELNSVKTGFLVFAKTGSSSKFDDYTISFANESSFSVDTENVSFFRDNDRKAFTAVFASGISMSVSMGVKMLSVSVVIPTIFRGQTRGLLGNFDGSPTNEFICLNGTILNDNIREREIFQFGQSWAVDGKNTIFRYPTGKSHTDYAHPDYIPKFLDEADSKKVQNATLVCGEQNQECIFDLVFTGNDDVAKETHRISVEAQETRRQIENVIPHIQGPLVVEVHMNRVVIFSVEGVDDGIIGYRFIKNNVGATLRINDQCEAVVSFWTTLDSSIEISVVAEDDKCVLSNQIEPTIVLCSGCNDNGVCDYTSYNNDNRTTAKFKYARCVCNMYWSGHNCEEDLDSCTASPCSSLRNCTDYPPSLHRQLGVGYNCSDCPVGYRSNAEGKCIDVNECLVQSEGCAQICQNTEGSFLCFCVSTFRLNGDGKTCKDIDECQEAMNDCDQICNNTNGGYSCGCFSGYQYNDSIKQCVKGVPLDACAHMNCSSSAGCTVGDNGNATCFCKVGYHLSPDGLYCEDDDECSQNACQQRCTNTYGSFQCTCHAGFQPDKDKITCKSCDPLTYGENCSQVCECGRGVDRCDPVRGCICKKGWTGLTCEDDVDECNDPNICGDIYKTCVNTNGSYACHCVDGFIVNESNTCLDVNECMDPELNVCEQICMNTLGGFHCKCRPGYIIDPNNSTRCRDIEECVNGQSGCQQICENTPGKFTCSCYYGYAIDMDRKTCEPVEDPCSTFADLNCSQICIVDRDKQLSKCSCKQGFELLEDKQTCIDIDECINTRLNQCSQMNKCLNTDGGYTCSCSIGFRLENDGRTCTECDQYHYGPDCLVPCNCGIGADRCNPIKGCVCRDGWGGEKCTLDKNECAALPSPCPGENTMCINTNGSFICACAPGFSNSSNGCEDINECYDPLWNECDQICINKEGYYACACEQGFLKDGNSCRDIDECAGQNDCSHFCENTPGGYRCVCNEGFKLNVTDKRTCIPAFTCQTIDAITCKRKGALCVEKNGSAECYCDKGYVFAKNETCEDFNECTNNPCSESCTNSLGGYICSCGPGKMIANDSKTCTDCPEGKYGDDCRSTCSCNVSNTEKCQKNSGECRCFPGWDGSGCELDRNECLNPFSCHSNSTCANTMGSYTCKCHTGFFQTASGECHECDSKHYGIECSDECTCVIWNTHSCDKVDGTCTCLNGWTGVSCGEAIEFSTDSTAATEENIQTSAIGKMTAMTGTSTISAATARKITASLNPQASSSTPATLSSKHSSVSFETTANVHISQLPGIITSSATDNPISTILTTATTQLTVTTTTASSSSDHLATASASATTSSLNSTSTMTPSGTNNDISTIPTTTANSENGTRQTTMETTGMTTASTNHLTVATTATSSSNHLATSSASAKTSSLKSKSIFTPSGTNNGDLLRITCTVTFDIELSASIDLNVEETTQHYLLAVKEDLKAYYQTFLLQSSVQVTIRSIRRGSLIVEHDVVLENTEEAKQQFTKAVTQLIIGQPVTIDGAKTTAKEVNVGGTSVSTGDNKDQQICSIYNALDGGCPDSFTCEVQYDYPRCRNKNTSEDFTMIIGICIGSGLLILIAFVLMIVSLQRRKKKQRDLIQQG